MPVPPYYGYPPLTIFRYFTGCARLFTLLTVGFVFSACSVVLPEQVRQGVAAPIKSESSGGRALLAEAEALYIESRLLAMEGDGEKSLRLLQQAVQLDSHDPFLRLSLADQYLSLGQGEQALRAAEDAVIQDPQYVEAHMLLGNLAFHAGNNEKAIQAFSRVLELEPDLEDAVLLLAITHARNDNFEQAVEVLKEFNRKHPDSSKGMVTLARLYQEMGLTGLAVESYNLLLEHHPEIESVYFELGSLYEEQGEYEQALAVYRKLLVEDPQNTNMRHHVARLFIANQKYDEALNELQELLRIRPDDIEALRKVGLIHLEQGLWAAAAKVFLDLLEINPEIHQARFYLGTALERNNDFQGAMLAFSVIPEDSELYDDAMAHLSYLHHRLGQTDEAIVILEKVLSRGSERPELFAFLASLYEDQERFDQALLILDRGLTIFPQDSGLLYHKGVTLERTNERVRAIEVMRQVIKESPDHAEALNYMAYSFAEDGQNLDEALDFATRALALKPEGHIFDTLGWVFYRLGRFEDARRQLEHAADLMPEDPVVLQHLGDAYRELKLFGKARAVYQSVLELTPDDAAVQKKLDELGR